MADVIFGPTKRHDRRTSLLMTLQRGDGTYPDLSGLLVSDVKLHLKNKNTGAFTAVNVSAIVTPTNPAVVRYDPSALDVATVCEYEMEVQVIDGSGLPETFPSCDRFLWSVVANLA